MAAVPRHSVIAIGLLALATLVRWLLDPYLGNHLPYGMLYIAVAVIAWRTTTPIAIASLIVGWFAADFLFVPPRFKFFRHVEEPEFLDGTFTYFAVAATSIIVAHAMRAAHRAAETGKRLAAMHANTAIGLTELTLDGRWIIVNDAFCRIVSYTRDELLTLRFFDITFAEDIPHNRELVSQLATGQIPSFRLETRFVRKDGSLVWVDVDRRLITDDAGRPLYMVGAIVDITARKQAEERLRASDEQLLALFESAPDGNVVVDPQGNIRAVNAQTERLFGYRRDELVGRPVEVLMPDRTAARHGGHRTDYMSQPCTRQMGAELPLFGKRKDGSEFPADILLSPVEIQGGQVLAVVRDISQRKRAEQAAQGAREYAEAILRTSTLPLLVLENDLRVVTANEAFYKKFLVESKETEGRIVYDLGNRQWDTPKLREALEGIVPKQQSFEQFEVEHWFQSIGQRTMVLSGRRMETLDGERDRIILVIEDITARKQAETELKKSQQQFAALAGSDG